MQLDRGTPSQTERVLSARVQRMGTRMTCLPMGGRSNPSSVGTELLFLPARWSEGHGSCALYLGCGWDDCLSSSLGVRQGDLPPWVPLWMLRWTVLSGTLVTCSLLCPQERRADLESWGHRLLLHLPHGWSLHLHQPAGGCCVFEPGADAGGLHQEESQRPQPGHGLELGGGCWAPAGAKSSKQPSPRSGGQNDGSLETTSC